jgi:hypothetical protein
MLMSLQNECIFYFLNNNDKDNDKDKDNKKKTIHKIVYLDFFVRNELTNMNKIKKILDYKNYYYICENSSELKITSLTDDIRHIKSGIKIKSDETVLMKFDDRELIYLKNYLKTFGSSSLTKGSSSLTKGSSSLTKGSSALTKGSSALTKGSSALSSFTIYIFTIIDFYKRLLKSISLLVEQQIVHNHINFDSIVVDKHFAPLISNFSFSIDITNVHNIKQFFIAYDPSYLEWPLEIHLLSYLITNKLTSLSSSNIENVIHDVLKDHTILKTFGDSVVSSYKLESLNYFKKYVNQSYEYILTDCLQYSCTWDNYALSIMFLRILIGIHRSIDKKNKFIILFMKLLVSNIHLNPLKRCSIGSTTIQFNHLLDSLEPKDYKEVIDGLND